MEPKDPTESTEEAAQPDVLEMLGLRSVFTGTLTVDRTNEEVPDGESTDAQATGEDLPEAG